jgi:uncharacterized protein
VIEAIERQREEIAEICRRRRVRRLWLFGSATGNLFDPDRSDVDLLVEFGDDDADLFGAYFGLQEDLQDLLGWRVDLVMPVALRNPYFAREVEETRQALYAA